MTFASKCEFNIYILLLIHMNVNFKTYYTAMVIFLLHPEFPFYSFRKHNFDSFSRKEELGYE